MNSKQLSLSSYVMTMFGVTLIFGFASVVNLPLILASGLAAVAGFAVVEYLQRLRPLKKSWAPQARELSEDISYMVLVQGLLPKLVALGVTIYLSKLIWPGAQLFSDLWPQATPLLLETFLFTLVVEFPRYWLHRLGHGTRALWSLHKVHHRPEKLYALNVMRFHPFEKMLQMLPELFLVAVLQPTQECLALYFSLYAVNGFFQHANIDIKWGVLNYLISTAELHRWHHDKEYNGRGCNFGNNLIIWDIIFGTYYRKAGKAPKRVGINKNDSLTGFERFISKSIHWCLKCFIQIKQKVFSSIRCLSLDLIYQFQTTNLLRKTSAPELVQALTLTAILKQNKNAEFGKQYHFDSIDSVNNFRLSVPICEYEDLRNMVEIQASTDKPTLTLERPKSYLKTSGTTNQPKYLPLTDSGRRVFNYAQRLSRSVQYKLCPAAFKGKALIIVGNKVEEQYKSKICGSASGLLFDELPVVFKDMSVCPPQLFAEVDYPAKYYAMLLCALASDNLSYISTPNPATLLYFYQLLIDHKEDFYTDIKRGKIKTDLNLSTSIRSKIDHQLISDPVRAEQIKFILSQANGFQFTDLWPQLEIISTWKSGNCKVSAQRLEQLIDDRVHYLELGYIASEVHGAIALSPSQSGCLPIINGNFYEFIETEKWHCGDRETKLLHELEIDKQYYLIVTTKNGLYRYFMNDVVEVTGYENKTPLLTFLRKGKGMTSICGEKLHENQLIEAVMDICAGNDLSMSFFICLADQQSQQYVLYMEDINCDDTAKFAQWLDNQLSVNNSEYQSKRASERLKRIRVKPLRAGTYEKYKKFNVNKGQRESQYKIISLQNKTDVEFDFEQHVAA